MLQMGLMNFEHYVCHGETCIISEEDASGSETCCRPILLYGVKNPTHLYLMSYNPDIPEPPFKVSAPRSATKSARLENQFKLIGNRAQFELNVILKGKVARVIRNWRRI